MAGHDPVGTMHKESPDTAGAPHYTKIVRFCPRAACRVDKLSTKMELCSGEEIAVTRAARNEVRLLKQEAQGLEIVATEAEVEPHRLQEYWALSMDLVALVMDIDGFAERSPNADEGDPQVIALRHRLRDIAGRLADVTAD